MLRYILKRILYIIPIMLGVITIVFILRVVMPGDPVDLLVSNDATPEERQQVREFLGLDKPIPVQYVNYIVGVFTRADFGVSYKSKQPVLDELMMRFPTTFKLAVVTVCLGTCLAIPMGVISAVKWNTWVDGLILVISMVAASMPDFWFALMLMIWFSVNLNWFPSRYDGTWISWILPITVTVVGSIANLTRLTRTTMLEVIRSDYVRTARAKGQVERKVIFYHALRNALIPVLNAVGGTLGMQLGGALIMETMFGMPGIGKYIGEAIQQRNFPSVQGGVILLAFIFSMVNLIVDLSYTFVDPRLKTTIITVKPKKIVAEA